MRRLMILEASQKQTYIFTSRRLQENAARSEVIRYVTESRFPQTTAGPLYREEGLVYVGGNQLPFVVACVASSNGQGVTT